jgi:hypothetical protein
LRPYWKPESVDEKDKATMAHNFPAPTLRQEQRINTDSQRSNDSKRDGFCAYNLTGQRFISNEVEVADAVAGGFEDCYSSLLPGSGTAVWIVPVRGISVTSFCIPVDLLYLDETCTVLATVGSFPIARVSSSIARAASILVLPEHTVLLAGIEVGDELMVCSPEEMQDYLLHARSPLAGAGPNQTEDIESSLLRGHPLWEVRERKDAGGVAPALEPAKVEKREPAPVPVTPTSGRPKASWWRKLLFNESDDQRWGERKALPGLIAYFFTGGAPTAHRVQNISTSGLFVLTSERWYPGTYVRLTLADEREPSAERSITLYAKVVRSTDSGVGFEFLLNESNVRLGDFGSKLDQLPRWNIQELEEFVAGFKSDS